MRGEKIKKEQVDPTLPPFGEEMNPEDLLAIYT